MKYSRVKSAIVGWGMPGTIQEFGFKIFEYARWDAKSGIWWNPVQRFSSHNIHSLLILFRYLIGISILILGFFNHRLWLYGFIAILLYGFWAYRKAGLWGIILQFTADFAVIGGFLSGILQRS